MNPNTITLKDKKIKIFTETNREDLGISQSVKIYQHPINTVLKANIRQLSADETNADNADQNSEYLVIVVNHRILPDSFFVEFRGSTYKSDGIDKFEFYKGEIKFRAHRVNSKEYDVVEYKEWS